MKCISLIAVAFTLILSSCNGQEEKIEIKEKSSIKPKTDIKVNKKYDKDGNLVKYDSTYYYYYYSNIENDTILGDSVFDNFKLHFNKKYPFSFKPFFKDLFFQDTLLQYDFYKKDFFKERFKNNMDRMDKLFWEMDSLKNNFFMDQFPEEYKEKKNEE